MEGPEDSGQVSRCVEGLAGVDEGGRGGGGEEGGCGWWKHAGKGDG